jgi:hypothetical protein
VTTIKSGWPGVLWLRLPVHHPSPAPIILHQLRQSSIMQSFIIAKISSSQISPSDYHDESEPANEILDMPPPGPILVEPTAGIWPNRIPTSQERESILQRGIIYIQKILQFKVQCPSSQDRVWYEQFPRFTQRQYTERTIPDSSNQPGRVELSEDIARSYGCVSGKSAAERIRLQETLCIIYARSGALMRAEDFLCCS